MTASSHINLQKSEVVSYISFPWLLCSILNKWGGKSVLLTCKSFNSLFFSGKSHSQCSFEICLVMPVTTGILVECNIFHFIRQEDTNEICCNFCIPYYLIPVLFIFYFRGWACILCSHSISHYFSIKSNYNIIQEYPNWWTMVLPFKS